MTVEEMREELKRHCKSAIACDNLKCPLFPLQETCDFEHSSNMFIEMAYSLLHSDQYHGDSKSEPVGSGEETNLSPEEIVALKADNKRLHRLIEMEREDKN